MILRKKKGGQTWGWQKLCDCILQNKFRSCFEVEFLTAAVWGINKKKLSQSFDCIVCTTALAWKLHFQSQDWEKEIARFAGCIRRISYPYLLNKLQNPMDQQHKHASECDLNSPKHPLSLLSEAPEVTGKDWNQQKARRT